MNKITNKQIAFPLSGSFSGSLEGTASFATNGFPFSGSAVIKGSLLISGSGGDKIFQIHGVNDSPWTFGLYNDTYNPTQSVLAGFIWNDGRAAIGTEVNKALEIYTNANYLKPTLTISSSGITTKNSAGNNVGLNLDFNNSTYLLGDKVNPGSAGYIISRPAGILLSSEVGDFPSILLVEHNIFGTSVVDNNDDIRSRVSQTATSIKSDVIDDTVGVFTTINQTSTNIQITGSTYITGSLTVTNGITGSLLGTASYAATASNILGGKATHIPYFATDTTLATSSLFQSGSTSIIINQDNNTAGAPEALYVWQPITANNGYNVVSGKGSLNNYLQLNIQNLDRGTNASSDIVATAGIGDESSNYIDMGINSDGFSGNLGNALDAYLYSTGQHLHIGNATAGQPIQFFAGGTNTDTDRKFQLSADNQHNMTGSLDISGSLNVRRGITGSLFGSASYAITASFALNVPATASFAVSSSYAIQAGNATNADRATTADNGGVISIIAGPGILLSPAGGQGNVQIISTGGGGGGVTIISGSNATASFSNSSTWTFNHSLGSRTPIISVFDTNYNQVIPDNIQLVDSNTATITFPTLESGFAIASLGGGAGSTISSSYASFASVASFASTASYFAEVDPVFVAKSASLATTGSNIFKGNQIVTGSLSTSGSNTLIGSTSLTGSLNITGSTIQTGNNTLTGTTSLTGNILMTGSILIFGDVVPQVSSSYSLGSITQPWKSLYVQSGSINIQSDAPGEPNAELINLGGDVSIKSAGFRVVSGSTTPFRVDPSGRIRLIVPTIPAGDIGAFSIVGNTSGYYQPVTTAGGMIHVTGNDGLSTRVNLDTFSSGSTIFGSIIVGRTARGTAAVPSQSKAGDVVLRLTATGWRGDTGFGGATITGGATTTLDFINLEDQMDNARGSAQQFYNAPIGTRNRVLSAQIDATGIQTSGSVRAASFTGSFSGSLVGIATSASYASNGGVTQLLAGANITLSPSSGIGQVTISSTGGSGGAGGNSITSSYGAFYSTQQQTNPAASTPNSMSFNNTYISNGVYLTGSTNTRIKVDQAGTYNLSLTAQFDRTDDATKPSIPVTIWLRKNGSNLAYTAISETVDVKSTNYVAAWNYFLNASGSDSYEVMWQSSYTTVALTPTSGSLTGPSVAVTMNRVDMASSNTGSFSGSFTGVLIGTASYSTTSSYALNGGVTQIIAGNNITITNGGSGSVTINAATSGSVITTGSFATTGSNIFVGNQGITGSVTISSSLTLLDGLYANGNKQYNYGQFYSTASQAGSANASSSFTYTTTDFVQGMSLVSGSRITVDNSGVYKIDIRTVPLTGANATTMYTWIKKNGTNIANTTVNVGPVLKNISTQVTPSYIVTANAGDYFEVVKQFDAALVTYPYSAATGNIPATPSIITIVTQIA